jgi:uncharacterized protein
MSKLKGLDMLALVLVIIGGLNWGLVGLWDLNIISKVFGVASVLTKIVYILVGLSGVYVALIYAKLRKEA